MSDFDPFDPETDPLAPEPILYSRSDIARLRREAKKGDFSLPPALQDELIFNLMKTVTSARSIRHRLAATKLLGDLHMVSRREDRKDIQGAPAVGAALSPDLAEIALRAINVHTPVDP